MGFEKGGAVAIVTSGDGITHTIADAPAVVFGGSNLSSVLDKLALEVKFLLIIADTGNGAAIKVGPNGAAVVPLPNTVGANILPQQFVDPAQIAFNDGGTAGLKLYVTWGAVSDRWLAARQRSQRS